ncbi:MAG: pilus assembly protein PilP [Burkholderiales bacterium]|nr:pilus assembly protein PilP [Burkholderiales bacterium]
MKRIAMPVLFLALVGCGDSGYQDLQAFMRDAEKNSPRKIEPLPEMKAYAPFEYAGFDLPEPFRPRKLTPAKGDSAFQPDLNRRKEALESYPLESLKMVGTLQQGKEMFALVRVEKTVYRVKQGNYLGQNFGLITSIGDTDVKLKEIVQDAAGDWTERVSALQLIDESDKK